MKIIKRHSLARAAMMLLMMLTTATAWANDYTVTYQAKFAYMGALYNIILQRNDNSSLSATIAEKSSAWQGNTGVRVDDEYDITFKPSQNLYVATNPGTTTAIGFNMSSGTTITASVASNSSYYVKQVRLLDNGVQKATSAAMAPNSRSATVTASGDIQFNYIEVTLTNDYYGTITPQDGLTLTATASLTYNNTNYYKSGTEITMNAPANRAIDAATGVSGATIAANKRSYTFAMPKQNVTPGATMSEVHTISCPSGLTVTSSPYCTDNTTKYYKKGETYTLTVDDANKVIQSFNATGADGSSVANDKKSATVTIGTSNVTVTATLQAISGTTTDDGLSWSLAQDGSGNYTRLTVSGSGAMKTYSHNTVDGLWRTNAPWGWHLTSATVGDGVTSIGTQAFIGCQSLATVTLGSSVTTIGNNAFDHCDALTQITLPASVTTLNDEAFKNCSGLERIDIQHDGAVTLGSNVFQNCGNLQYIVFPSPAAVQANTTGNWSSLAEKRRAKFGHKHFGVTKDATNTAVYAIATDDDLRNLASAVNGGNDGSGKTFLQTANIDLGGSNSPFTPIGYGRYFQGTYDGGSHTVSRLYIYAGNDNCIGFFCNVMNGTVRNVILASPDVTNTFNRDREIRVGALIGDAEVATVENCLAVSPTVDATGSGTKYIGALIGQTGNSTRVTNCSFYAGTGNASTGIGRRMDSTIGDVGRAYKVTLGENAGLPDPPATGGFIVQGSHYYAQGATAQLSYTGSIPNGYRVVYTVSPDNTGATVTEQGVLTMGSADITITAKLSSTPLININTGTIADIPDQAYTGSAIVPDITLTVGDRKLTEGTDYLVSCTNNVNLGTATLTATGMGDYTGTLTKNFRICYTDKTGSCGANVTYTLHDEDQDGHYEQLTISGTGAMTDFNAPDDVPWKAYLDDITSVIVQSGVTSIGAQAFCLCQYLTSVSLSEGLTSIGRSAFRYCYRLSALVVPASVESVGSNSFEKLALSVSGGTLTFASGSRLTSVGNDAFYYAHASVDMSACTRLTAMPKAFQSFDKDVTFPHSLTSIAAKCFDGYGSEDAKVYVHVPDNYVLTVNDVTISATNGKADITSAIGVGTDHDAVTLSCIPDPTHFSQSGDEYTIHTTTGWNIFCDILNDYPKGYFTGKTVRLGDNITVSRMAGSSNHDFTGTFDGNKKTLTVNYSGSSYVAPFPYVDGATIQDLVVDGTISSTGTRAAGVIGETGTTISHITNCVSSSTISGGNFSGGFSIGGNVAIEGCVFDGTIDSGGNSGGFVGYSQGALTITNCLFAPQSGSSAKGTFHFNGTAGTLTNCYYTETLGTEQGKQRRSIAAGDGVTVAHAGAATTYSVSGITAYKASDVHGDNDPFIAGLLYNNVLYAGSGDAVSLTLTNTPTTGYGFDGYTASPDGATLTEDGDNYTLTMPDEDVTIGATFSLLPGIVSYIDENGDEQPVEAIPLQGGEETTLAAGWYVAQGTDPINYTGKITLGGDVNIILADGCTLNIGTEQKRISSNNCISGGNYTLTIYGQTDGDGILNAYTSNSKSAVYVKNYTQHGGTVTIDATNSIALTLNLGDLTLTRGSLTAKAVDYNAIHLFSGYTVTVSGGTLTATGGCAIGGSLTMSGGNVNASGGNVAILFDTTVSGGTLTATGLIKGNLALSGNATATVDGTVNGTVTIASGQVFTDGNGHYYAGTLTDDEKNTINGQTLTRLTALQLADDADNTDAIAKCNGITFPVTLQGRKLWKDGAWNTLCLPFAVDLTADGCPLKAAGVVARTLTEASISGTTLNLTFGDAVTTLTAGVPYIIKWTKDEVNPTIDDPVFSGVTIDATDNSFDTERLTNQSSADYDEDFATDERVRFIGTYSPKTFTAEDKSILFLGTDNTLYYPQPVIDNDNDANPKYPTIGACRAYFKIGEDETQARQLTAFNIDFGDGSEDTGIISVSKESSCRDRFLYLSAWYTLDGVKLDGKPTRKGLYIHNGKKVVVK